MKPRIHLSPTSEAAAPEGDPTAPEAIVRVVLEKSPLLVYIVNLDFKVVLANRSLREVTGYDTSDCPNVDALIDRFYPHGDEFKQRVLAIHEGWRRNEHVMGAKLLVQCKNGSQRTIAWYTSRLRVGRGPTVGYVAMGLDLTTQGTLEQWVDLLQRTLQHLSEGVILTDSGGAVLAWNEGATRLLGYTEAGMQGQPFDQLFPPAQRSALVEEIDEAINGSSARFADELELQRSTGGTRELSFVQVRLDGEGGAPLARLTVLAPPESEGDDLIARAAALEAQLHEVRAEKDELQGKHAHLSARVSTLDAEVATQGAAAGQIADLRGQLELALTENEAARKRIEELEAVAAAVPVALDGEDLSEVEVEMVDEAPTATPSELPAVGGGADDEALAAVRAELQAAMAEIEVGRAEIDAATALMEEAQAALEAMTAERDAALAAAAASGEADAATARATEAEAARDSAQAEAEAARAELAALQTRHEATSAELDAATAALHAAQKDLEVAETAAAAAREERDSAQRALEDAQESFVLDRAKLEDEHRAAVDALSVKASEQRRSLEAQLHKDILAAEERAEMEHQKLLERFANEKKDLAQAAEIAHAQLESRSAQIIDGLRAELAQVAGLQPHLEPVSAAVVSADTTGKVIGWSAGAEQLEGRPASEALGKVIFDDVLAMRGLKWKTLFGKVVISGTLDKEVSLRRADGTTREVTLHARLIRNENGAPLGVTAEVEEQTVAPSAVAREDAAVLRLLAPFRQQLAAQSMAALEQLQGTVARVRQIERLGTQEGDLPLDGLVAQVASATGGKAVCELGSTLKVGDRGRAIASLLFSLVDGQTDAVMSTVGSAAVEVRGASWSASTKRELSWLAAEGRLGLSFAGREAHVSLAPKPAPLPSPEGDETDLRVPVAADEDPAPEAPADTSADAAPMDLELDEPQGGLDIAGSDDEIDLDPEEDDPDLVRSGRVQFVGADGEDMEVYAGEVYAGEDSIIKSEDAIYMAVSSLAEVDPVLRTSAAVLARKGEAGPISGELPPLDELDEVTGGRDGVSAALLHTAGAMDAYVAGNTVADDELEDSAAAEAAGPSADVLAEMRSTDAGEDAADEPRGSSKKRRRSRKRKS